METLILLWSSRLEKPGLQSNRPISWAAQSFPGQLDQGCPLIIERHLPVHHQIEGIDYLPDLSCKGRKLLAQSGAVLGRGLG